MILYHMYQASLYQTTRFPEPFLVKLCIDFVYWSYRVTLNRLIQCVFHLSLVKRH